MLLLYIVGAQSVGKTTLIRRLQMEPQFRGVQVVCEVARDLIRRDSIDLAVFQDYKNHEEDFYQFNVKLVQHYLAMARQDMTIGANRFDPDGSRPTIVKLYDRSGADAIAYICTYLPHLSDRMLSEQCCQDLLKLYAGAGTKMLLVAPHKEFLVSDRVRLPPKLPELLLYTENLRQLLRRSGVDWTDVAEKDLEARVRIVSGLLQDRPSTVSG